MAVAVLLGRIRDAGRVEVSHKKAQKEQNSSFVSFVLFSGEWWFSPVVLALMSER